MKTARWFQENNDIWLLRNGSTVLARIRERHTEGGRYIRDYVWSIENDPAERGGRCDTLYAAQRAARKALKPCD